MFEGSQTQPHGRTVEDALQRALRKTGAGQRVALASRTDAGVSALGNVFALKRKLALGRINAELEGVICLSYCEVPEEFNPRLASSRWYRYVLPDEMLPAGGASSFASALALFRGEHDFAAFCRERERSTRLAVDEVRVDRSCGSLIIDIRAPYFLRNQVRFMVGAALLAAMKRDIGWIARSLGSGKRLEAVEPAPAEGLILMDVAYEGVEFRPGWDPALTAVRGRLLSLQQSAAVAEWERSLLAARHGSR
jgi:tRNA pseudouridine38-40 synthase